MPYHNHFLNSENSEIDHIENGLLQKMVSSKLMTSTLGHAEEASFRSDLSRIGTFFEMIGFEVPYFRSVTLSL